MWQEIITYGIGLFIIIYLGIKVYRFFYCKKKYVSRCDECPHSATSHKQNPSGAAGFR